MSRHGSLVIVGFFVMFMFIGQILAQQQAIALHEADVGSGPSLVRPEAEESFSHSQDENSDSLIWDTVGSPSTLDPHRCYEGFGNWISENVYETLFTYPFDSPDTTTLIPLLAESVDISTDGLDYTFTLRQGVTFHDGTSFNASCVKDNFERLLKIFDTNGPAWMIAERLLGGQAVEDAAFTFGPGSQEHIDAYDAWTEMGSILVLSEYVVKMRLAAPYAGFLQCLACQEAAMISPTWFEAHGPVGYGEFNEYVDSHTCGTGPYMVDEWVVGGHITLTKNPKYWRESLALQTYPESGSIHTVVIRTVEDFEERKLNVLSGQSDGCHWPRANALEIWDPVGGQSLDPDISVYTGEPSYTTMALAINLHDQYNLSGVFVENPFASKDLREACSYAFDYASFIDSAWQGQALRGQGPLPSGMFGHDDNLFMYDLDLQLAVDAWNRAMESGLDTALAESFYCLNLYYTVRDEATRVLREDSLSLFKAGIEAILSHPDAVQPSQPLDIQVFELELADYLAYRGYESHLVMLVGWAPDYADPDNYLFPFCHSQGVYSWWIGYGDSQVDEWIDSSRGESDTVIRIQQIHQIQQAIVDAAAYIWLGQPTSFEVMRADVQGYSYNPMRYQPSGYSGGGAYFYHMWLIGRSLEPEPSSDTIVWETAGNPDTLDPHRNYGAFGIGITNNVYETLFTYAFDSADTSTLVPLLAESADISSDGYEYTITLREGVAFHDGTPFNASCVKYNLERAMKIFDPAGPAWELGETLLGAISVQNAVFSYGQGSQEHIDAYETWVGSESIAILDTYMVRIRLERPFAPFLHVLAFPVCSMISPTWVERHGGVQHGQSSGFVDARTCGTGPYCVTECLYNDHITLTRNPDYWRASEVHALKPNAGSIQTVVLWNNDDAASREARLLSGRIDGCFWPRDDALQIWDPVTRQSLDPDVNVWTEDLTYTMFALGFNMREYIQSFGFARQNPFYSRDLRAACSYAFDYALFIDTTFHGLAIQGKGPIPAGMYGHDNNLFMYHNDIQLAVESWNQAMASGLDSVLADNSYELNLYCHPDSAFQVQALNVFKAGLDAILAHEDAVQPSQEL
ncbi:MAG: ABC transporter substrate-binding protein, partial [Candidatus Thorarchaeota archaeon SMTZ1-83]